VEGEAAKCRLIQAMVLKGRDHLQEAFDVLEPVAQGSGALLDAYLRGRFLCELADIAQLRNDLSSSASLFGKAEALLKDLGPSSARADLAAFIGGAFARIGNLERAIASVRQGILDSIELGLRTRVAYLRVVHADLLLAADRSPEAESEILAALPTIEEQAMMPEGLAALTLLKESVQRRKMDPSALRELRERLHWKRWE
jgi:tetratricopeptide (TPR) repeat protein